MNEVKQGSPVKGWGLLLIALVIAAGAFWLATRYLTNKEGLLREQIIGEKAVTSSYVVASVDLLPGDIIGPENMAVAKIVSDNISAFAITPDIFDDYDGQVIKYPMSAGEPLLSHFVAGQGIERFSDLLEKNERAITLEIDNLSSASGMLVAGDYVDLMLVMDVDDDDNVNAEKNLRPLMQNVRVLAVDALPLVSKQQDFVALNTAVQGYSSVTVGLKFSDASKLVLARDVGDIVFMLRNKDDHHLHDASLITQLDLNKSTTASKSYQYYSSSNSKQGVIAPALKSVNSNTRMDSSKMIYSLSKSKKDNLIASSQKKSNDMAAVE